MAKSTRKKIRLSDTAWLSQYNISPEVFEEHIRPVINECLSDLNKEYINERGVTADKTLFYNLLLGIVLAAEHAPFLFEDGTFSAAVGGGHGINRKTMECLLIAYIGLDDAEILDSPSEYLDMKKDIDWKDIRLNALDEPLLGKGDDRPEETIAEVEEENDGSKEKDLTKEECDEIMKEIMAADKFIVDTGKSFSVEECKNRSAEENQKMIDDIYAAKATIDEGFKAIEYGRPIAQRANPTLEGVDIIPSPVQAPEVLDWDNATLKSDLYLAGPIVDCIDPDRIHFEATAGDYHYIMYEGYPPVPENQSQIDCTTNESIITTSDAMKLYPNRYIKTRSKALYQQVPGVPYHELLGCVLPIEGFTQEQVIDNIIRYPHFHWIRRIDGDGSYGNDFTPFWGEIELDGELYDLKEIWETLPESKVIPYHKDFMKEYQIRRYLLERDIKGIKHNYPIQGELGEFITLFMPSDMYIQLGYTNVEEIAKTCIHSRVRFKRSRNPMLRRFGVEK